MLHLVTVSRDRSMKLILVADVDYFARHAQAALLSGVLDEAIRVGTRVPLP